MKKIILISIICAICVQVQSQSWNITGNAGTNATTNFIGTTDNIAFKIRTNNSVRLTVNGSGKVGIGITSPVGKLHVKGNTNVSQLMIDAGSTQTNANPLIQLRKSDGTKLMQIHSDNFENVFMGWNAGNTNDLTGGGGLYNSFIGSAAGYSNTTGALNTALGRNALYSNTWGQDNTAVGTNALYSTDGSHHNTAVGSGAMYANTSGTFNTACGAYAHNSGNGTGNSAFGALSLYSGTTGDNNTAVGHNSLYSNTTGTDNTATGKNALYYNNQGYHNTAMGTSALYSNTYGYRNTATGMEALYLNKTGFYNTASGYQALYSDTSGAQNTANGVQALYSNTSGNANTAIGMEALSYNTTGNYNTASGLWALRWNSTGSSNTASGMYALYSNVAGSNGTAIGYDAMGYCNNTATPFINYNVAIGFEALKGSFTPSANTGNSNTVIGYQTLMNNTSGGSNSAIGTSALFSNTTSGRNTAIGWRAGDSYANGYYNTFVGAECDASAAAWANSSAMGDAALITASNQARIGDGGVSSIGGYAGWTTLPSDGRFKQNIKENVPGIEFISKLRPVTYTLDIHGVNQYIGVKENGKENIYDEKSRIRYTGFVAQEVESAAKETGFDFSGVDAPKNEKDVYGLRYAEFVVPLVKAVQELNEKIQKSEARSQKLEDENELIKSVLTEEQQQKLKSLRDGKPPSPGSSGGLEQNSPNPFNTQTEIRFRLPEKFNSAQLKITDANGKQIRSVDLKSSSSFIIKASELSGGMYSYSLVIDGVNVDSKQMILTK